MSSKLWVLVALAVVSFVAGGIDQYFYPGVPMPPSSLVSTVLCALLIFAWYRIDARQRGYRRSRWMDVGVVFLAVIALPIYFFRTRGAKVGFAACGLFLLSIIGFGVLGIAGQYTTYYGLQA